MRLGCLKESTKRTGRKRQIIRIPKLITEMDSRRIRNIRWELKRWRLICKRGCKSMRLIILGKKIETMSIFKTTRSLYHKWTSSLTRFLNLTFSSSWKRRMRCPQTNWKKQDLGTEIYACQMKGQSHQTILSSSLTSYPTNLSKINWTHSLICSSENLIKTRRGINSKTEWWELWGGCALICWCPRLSWSIS